MFWVCSSEHLWILLEIQVRVKYCSWWNKITRALFMLPNPWMLIDAFSCSTFKGKFTGMDTYFDPMLAMLLPVLTCEIEWLSFICLTMYVYVPLLIDQLWLWPTPLIALRDEEAERTRGGKWNKMLQIAQMFPSLNFCSALVCKLFHLQLHYIFTFVGMCRLNRAAGCIGL